MQEYSSVLQSPTGPKSFGMNPYSVLPKQGIPSESIKPMTNHNNNQAQIGMKHGLQLLVLTAHRLENLLATHEFTRLKGTEQ